MARFDLNLSTRPFPAYRRTNISLLFGLVVLALVSVWQVMSFTRYSGLTKSIQSQERDLRVETDTLGKRVSELETLVDRPESTAKLNEIGYLNHLILRKNLSWTRLFAVLEEILPDNVHFTNLAPDVGEDGSITLNLNLQAKSIADIKQFLQRVEKSPLFENILVNTEERQEETGAADVHVTLSAIYHPQRDGQ